MARKPARRSPAPAAAAAAAAAPPSAPSAAATGAVPDPSAQATSPTLAAAYQSPPQQHQQHQQHQQQHYDQQPQFQQLYQFQMPNMPQMHQMHQMHQPQGPPSAVGLDMGNIDSPAASLPQINSNLSYFGLGGGIAAAGAASSAGGPASAAAHGMPSHGPGSVAANHQAAFSVATNIPVPGTSASTSELGDLPLPIAHPPGERQRRASIVSNSSLLSATSPSRVNGLTSPVPAYASATSPYMQTLQPPPLNGPPKAVTPGPTSSTGGYPGHSPSGYFAQRPQSQQSHYSHSAMPTPNTAAYGLSSPPQQLFTSPPLPVQDFGARSPPRGFEPAGTSVGLGVNVDMNVDMDMDMDGTVLPAGGASASLLTAPFYPGQQPQYNPDAQPSADAVGAQQQAMQHAQHQQEYAQDGWAYQAAQDPADVEGYADPSSYSQHQSYEQHSHVDARSLSPASHGHGHGHGHGHDSYSMQQDHEPLPHLQPGMLVAALGTPLPLSAASATSGNGQLDFRATSPMPPQNDLDVYGLVASDAAAARPPRPPSQQSQRSPRPRQDTPGLRSPGPLDPTELTLSYDQNHGQQQQQQALYDPQYNEQAYSGQQFTTQYDAGYGTLSGDPLAYDPLASPSPVYNYANPNILTKAARSMSLRSIDRIDLAAESEDMLFVAGDYGSATEPGGMFSLMPVESQLFASYVWHIPDLATSTDEKLVSLPFGPRDWSWQIVIYPDGAGDCQGAYASAFIRPIKNETENAAKDAWMRPISSFTFRLRRGARQEPSQERDDEEGGDASLAEPEQAASPDYVLTHVSEPSFTGFSAAQSGWGFEEFYQLPLPHDAISPEDGSVTIEVEVIGPQVIQTGTIQYEYTIPHFAGAARGESSDPHISLPFGPSGCSWVAQVYCQGNNESRGSHVSAYLSPIKSDFEEALGPHWSRAISTFTIKLIHPATRQTIVSKSITGGFLFRDGEALLTGWDQLWPLDRIEEALSGTDTLHLYVAVTWDPLHLAPSTSIGKVRAALAKVSQSQKRYKQAALSYREQTANLTTDLHRRTRELEHSQTRQKAFHDRLSVLQNRLADSQKQLQLAQRTDDEVAALRARVDLLTKELAVARESQMAGERQQIALAQAKLRLTALRTSLDEESFPTADAATASLADNDPAAAASSSDTDPIALQTRIVQLQRNVAELEYDLAQTKSTLNDVMRQQTDAALGEPIEAADAPEPALHDRVQAALSAAVDEINLGSATLEEANSKLSVLGPETRRSERASIVAEIAMIQCGIEVARASLLETYELAEAAGALPIDGFDQVYNDLDMVRSQLGQTRACLEDDSYLYRLAQGEDAYADQMAATASAGGVAGQDYTMQTMGDQGEYGQEYQQQQQQKQYDEYQQQQYQQQYQQQEPLDVIQVGSESLPPVPRPPSSAAYNAASLPPPPTTLPPMAMQHQQQAAGAPPLLTSPSGYSSGMASDAGVKDLEAIQTRMDSMYDLIKTALQPSAAGTPLFAAHALPGDGGNASSMMPPALDWDPEIWTPVGTAAPPLNADHLRSILQDLDHRRGNSGLGLWTLIISLLVGFFAMYSTVYIVCDPVSSGVPSSVFYPYQPTCASVVLPAWDAVSTQWHAAARHVVLDVGPTAVQLARRTGRKAVRLAGRAAGHARVAVADTMRKAVERGPDPLPAVDGAHGVHPLDHNVPKTERPTTVDAHDDEQVRRRVQEAVDAQVRAMRDQQTVERQAYQSELQHLQLERERQMQEMAAERERLARLAVHLDTVSPVPAGTDAAASVDGDGDGDADADAVGGVDADVLDASVGVAAGTTSAAQTTTSVTDVVQPSAEPAPVQEAVSSAASVESVASVASVETSISSVASVASTVTSISSISSAASSTETPTLSSASSITTTSTTSTEDSSSTTSTTSTTSTSSTSTAATEAASVVQSVSVEPVVNVVVESTVSTELSVAATTTTTAPAEPSTATASVEPSVQPPLEPAVSPVADSPSDSLTLSSSTTTSISSVSLVERPTIEPEVPTSSFLVALETDKPWTGAEADALNMGDADMAAKLGTPVSDEDDNDADSDASSATTTTTATTTATTLSETDKPFTILPVGDVSKNIAEYPSQDAEPATGDMPADTFRILPIGDTLTNVRDYPTPADDHDEEEDLEAESPTGELDDAEGGSGDGGDRPWRILPTGDLASRVRDYPDSEIDDADAPVLSSSVTVSATASTTASTTASAATETGDADANLADEPAAVDGDGAGDGSSGSGSERGSGPDAATGDEAQVYKDVVGASADDATPLDGGAGTMFGSDGMDALEKLLQSMTAI